MQTHVQYLQKSLTSDFKNYFDRFLMCIMNKNILEECNHFICAQIADSALKIGLLCDKIMGKCCRRAVLRLSFCYQNKMVSKQ